MILSPEIEFVNTGFILLSLKMLLNIRRNVIIQTVIYKLLIGALNITVKIMNGGIKVEKKRILIADDEERIVRLVSDFLNNSGYETVTASDGKKALEIFEREGENLSLAIIDIMMPEIDGWAITREIRKTSDLPIIMLSARAEEFDLLTGFESGIDEYVTKPFSPAVLVKRVDALIKRSCGKTVPKPEEKGLVIDDAAFLAYIDGKELELTLKEFELLSYLAKNSGRVLTRDQLLDAIWGYDYIGDSRTVDSHIARLRTKLGDFGGTHLKTIYGMGYKLEL